MKLRYWVLLVIMIVTPPAMWLFGVYEGIIIGVISPIFVIPVVIAIVLLWAGRNGRNVWK
jgi:phosphoglycerol transferase MdoB-like AlkP superfamily enzyme